MSFLSPGNMRKNLSKVGLTPERLFFTCYIVWLTFFFISSLTMFDYWFPRVFFIVMRAIPLLGLALSEYLNTTFSKKSLFGYLFIVLSGVVAYVSGDYYLFDISVIIVASRHYEFEKVVKAFLIVAVTMTFITIFATHLGLIQNRDFSSADRSRRAWGFKYATFLAHLFFFITMSFAIVLKEKFNYYHALILFIVNLWIFAITDTRNPFMLATLYIVFVYYYNSFEYFRELCLKVAKFLTPSFILTSCFIAFLSLTYKIFGFTHFFDKLLTGRIYLGHEAIRVHGIQPFGQDLNMVGYATLRSNHQITDNSYNYIDSSYLQILVLHGWIYFIALISLLTYTMVLIYRKKNMYLFAAMVLLAIHSMVDPQLTMLWYSPLLITIGMVFKDTPVSDQAVSIPFWKQKKSQTELKKQR